MEKLSTKDLEKIKPGASKMFALADARACHSARSLLTYFKRVGMPKTISDYKVEIDWKQFIVRITAIPMMEKENV